MKEKTRKHSKHADLENVPAVGKASEKAYIGEDEVVKIALEHAELTMWEVKELEVELDFDDGIIVYEVEFKSKGM